MNRKTEILFPGRITDRLILEVPTWAPEAVVQVRHNGELDEYICRIIINGKPFEAADYFTDDVEDAIGTANNMVADFILPY